MNSLTHGETEFMKIFYVYDKIERGQKINRFDVSYQKYRIFSPLYHNDLYIEQIIRSLVEKKYITNDLMLTEQGASYMYELYVH